MVERLDNDLVKRLEPPAKGYRIHNDTEVPGFGVRITAGGARAFVLSYRYHDPSMAARRSAEFRYTIGRFPVWTTTAARKAAAEWRQKMDRGEGHPLGERQGRRAAVRRLREAETFAAAVEDYVEREQRQRRKNSSADEVKRILLKEGAPWLDVPVITLDAREVRRRIEEIRDGATGPNGEATKGRPYLANKFHVLLSAFFSWCAEPGVELVPASPMIGLRRPWDGEEARSRFYSDDELRAIWRAADALGGTAGAYVKVLMLTGKRKTALAAMRWDELSDDGLWTPPSDNRRRKRNKRTHGIPLPALALRILRPLRPAEDAKDASPYVFPGRVRGTHLSPGRTLQEKIAKTSGVADFMPHGVRHTVETKMAELGVSPDLRDMVLDHAPRRGAGALYDHWSYVPQMREALETWAGRVERLVAPKGAAVLR